MNGFKEWFSLWDYPNSYTGEEPYFWDKSVFEGCYDFESQLHEIRSECLLLLENRKASPYFKKAMVSGGNGYNTLSLKWWDINFYSNRKHCPVLNDLLNKYPEISTLSINILEGNSAIHPHMGDTNTVFRAHFGLDIPSSLPECGIRVGDEKRSWLAGDWLVFTDAFEHETWNHSNQDRIILLIDMVRPEYLAKRKRICATVLCSLFLQKRMQKYPWVSRKIDFIIKNMAPFLILLIRVRVNFLNFIKKY